MKPNLDLPSHFLKYATVVLWAGLVWPVLGAQVLVPTGSVWKYLDNGTDQGTVWQDPSFNDGAWPSGSAQLGYGDGDEATVVSSGPNPTTKNITTYFRHSFDVANPSSFSNVTARLLEDDGAVVYVNGVEVFRSNLPPGPIAFNTFATVAAENQSVEFLIPPIVLVNGRNVIAVAMHQNNVASSDMSFDLEIVDNGGPRPPELPVVNVVATDPNATEGSLGAIDPGAFRFSRTGDVSLALTAFLTVTGTANNGTDYLVLTNRVTFNAGTSEASLIVSPLNDALIEGTETVVVTLQVPACAQVIPPPPGCYAVGASSQATVFIADSTSSNRPPVVQLVAPANGSVFNEGTNIALVATARDTDGTVTRVEFRRGSDLIGASTNPVGTNWFLTWSNALAGTHALQAVAVDNLNARSTSAVVNIIVRTNTPPEPGTRELHAISVYSGAFNGGASPHHEQGQASVVVNRPGQRVSLFLTSYEPVLWHVTSGNATVIEKVILGGYYRQEIDGLGAEVPVIRRYYDEGQGTSEYLYPGTTLESGRFFRILQKLCDLMGMDLASFQGTGLAPYPTPFVIDQVQNDVRLRCDYPQPVDPAQVPNLSFRMAFHDGGSGGGITFQDYTLQGGNPSRLLPTWRVVTDADSRYYYGADFHRSWRVDTQTGTVEELHLPPNLPEFSWPVGLTFDAPRNRILVATLVGEGYLYAYSPASSQWSLVSSLHNEDLDCLVYHTANDSLYGVKAAYYDGGAPAVLRFDTNGALTGQIPLPVQPYGVGFGGFRSELASVGEYLVLALETDTYIHDNGRPEARIYLIDPHTGEVQLTYRRVGAAPNQSPTVSLVSPSDGAVFPAGSSIHLEATASDPGGAVASVEFFVDGQSLGLGQILPGGSLYRRDWTASVGSHVLMAKATDNQGAATFSASVHITVETGGPATHVSLVTTGAVWRYLDDGTDQGTAWREPAFSDATWAAGPAQLGFGDGDEATIVSPGPDSAVKIITTYFRRSFTISNAAGASNLIVRLLRDDGAVVYLNGVEVFRSNLPEGPILYTTLALTAVGGAQESTEFLSAPIPSNLLREGMNVLAVEVHQVNLLSSDLSFDLSLEAEGRVFNGDVPSLEFVLTFFNTRSTDDVLFKHYTLAGPSDNRRLLPAMRVVSDYRQFYGTEGQSVFKVDSATRTAQAMVQPPDLAREGWPMGVAFDAPRQRVLVVSLGAEGFLHAYSPAQDQWSLVSSMNDLDLDCLVYHAPNDALYGVQVTYGGNVPGALYELGPNGEFRRQIPLPAFPFGVGPTGYQSELVSVGEYLVLLLEPQYGWADAEGESRIYLIDPRNGRWWLTYRRVGISENRVPTVSLTSPASGDTFPAGSSIALEATAADSDGTVQSVEFLANGQSLGFGTAIPGATLFRRAWSNAPPGQFTLTAKARDNEGGVGSSAPVPITIGLTNRPPEVRLTMPTNGATFMAPARIGLFAVANDPDGYPTLRYVQFFANDTSLGLRTNFPIFVGSIGPFFLLWTNVPAGQYTLTAKAVDDYGAMATSAPVHITVRDSSPMDTDGDGVPDDRDDCANTPAGALVNARGCSLDQLCPCPGPPGQHGDYVQCVIDHAWQFYREGLLTEDQRQEIIRVAAQSDCGQADGVRLHQQPQTPLEIRRDGREFIISGIHGGCVLECSTDLQTWIPTVSNPSAHTDCRIVDLESDPMPARFYRIRLIP